MSPYAPHRPCASGNCPALVPRGYCSACKSKRKAQQPKRVFNPMYNGRWRVARKRFLQANPFCVTCKEHDRLTSATEVDHIIPHKGDPTLFYDPANWQAMCESCHSRKTATEDGAFGREVVRRG